MKPSIFKKSSGEPKLVKGRSSALMVSLAIHAAVFFAAAGFVVFKITRPPPAEFKPPKPVKQVKMPLRKPKVKLKKNSRPKISRIPVQVKRNVAPAIVVPEMTGVGDGLSGGDIGNIELPEIEEISSFGDRESIGNDLAGTFYDFKRDRRGRTKVISPDSYRNELGRFCKRGWDKSYLDKNFYRSPTKLYATSILVPIVPSVFAPRAFNEAAAGDYCWAVLYEGQIVWNNKWTGKDADNEELKERYKDEITFRFWGFADDVLLVRVNGRDVLNAGWTEHHYFYNQWQSHASENRQFRLGNRMAEVGDWITLKRGESKKLQIVIGEAPGGGFCAYLLVEVKGYKYPKRPTLEFHGPFLPMFKTAVPTHSQVDVIFENLPYGECDVTNGPVFNDY